MVIIAITYNESGGALIRTQSAEPESKKGEHMNKQNTMPEIKEGDLIKLDYNDADHCDYYQFFDVRKLTVESCERLKTEGAYGEDPGRLYLLAWYCNRDSFVHFVDDEKDSVTAIYRKINKDYICIWEKEGNT